ncbi:hypothetical protein BT69DRAFT_572255 [Atractiella rhizophila]|nr:hypothetical protein BT69DRAFT_572255 [Atractiella rhizophila]
MTTLTLALKAGAILTGVESTPLQPGASNTGRQGKGQGKDMHPILRARLDAVSSLQIDNIPPFPTPALEEEEGLLESVYGSTALKILVLIARLSPTTSPSIQKSTSASPPTFGIRDVNVLRLLTGIVVRWGLKGEEELEELMASVFDWERKKATEVGEWVLREHLSALVILMVKYSEQATESSEEWKRRLDILNSSYTAHTFPPPFAPHSPPRSPLFTPPPRTPPYPPPPSAFPPVPLRTPLSILPTLIRTC